MTIYRDTIRCAVDLEQSLEGPGGRLIRGVSVVMADERLDEQGASRPSREPSVHVLSAAEARELAFELLRAAELAEHQGAGDER